MKHLKKFAEGVAAMALTVISIPCVILALPMIGFAYAIMKLGLTDWYLKTTERVTGEKIIK